MPPNWPNGSSSRSAMSACAAEAPKKRPMSKISNRLRNITYALTRALPCTFPKREQPRPSLILLHYNYAAAVELDQRASKLLEGIKGGKVTTNGSGLRMNAFKLLQ